MTYIGNIAMGLVYLYILPVLVAIVLLGAMGVEVKPLQDRKTKYVNWGAITIAVAVSTVVWAGLFVLGVIPKEGASR